MKPVALIVLCAALAAGCGDDSKTTSSTPPSTTSTTYPASTTTSTQPNTTTTRASTTTTTTAETQPAGAADPVAAATAVLTSQGTPQEACDRYVTEHFIETAYGGTENCLASRTKAALAEGLSLGPAIAEGATHLVVIPQGGPYDGAKVEVDLVRDGDTYLVDALQAHVPAGP